MSNPDLIPHLYRTEFSKITSVLCRAFGFEHIEIAEDIVSDTFLTAAENWGHKSAVPDNPVGWLHTVAKNKAKDYLKRHKLFSEKITPALKDAEPPILSPEIDLSDKNINDSQLQMMFAICNPVIPAEAQISLSLRILCGFGIDEIADAFLSNKETINKRLYRAKEKLKAEKVKIELPGKNEIGQRLETVLTTLYLLFNEGYYSASKNTVLRKDLCLEAMRLSYLLLGNRQTNLPKVNALMALMCFHASRFDARINNKGEPVLYEEQDTALWNNDLITCGNLFLNEATQSTEVSKYVIEAAIAGSHTVKEEANKWVNILQLYNRLLIIEYSPMAALNRTYALYRVYGNEKAIEEAEKLDLQNHYLYHTLLGELYIGIDDGKAIAHLHTAVKMAKGEGDKKMLMKKMEEIKNEK